MMAILPLMAALGGGEEPKVQLNVNLEMQGCCGNMACCSSNVTQRSSNKRIVYNSPAGGEDHPGTLSAEKGNCVTRALKALCCCASEPKETHNVKVRNQFVDYLIASHGQVSAQVAIQKFCEENGIDWHNPEQKQKSLKVKHALELEEEAKRIKNELLQSEVYKELMTTVSMRTRTIRPIRHQGEGRGTFSAAATNPRDENKSRSDNEDSNDLEKSSGFSLSPAAESDFSVGSAIIIEESSSGSVLTKKKSVEIIMPPSLKEAILASKGRLSPEDCIALYQAVKNKSVTCKVTASVEI